MLAFSLLFGIWGGYMHGNTLKNLYVMGYRNHFFQPIDLSLGMMVTLGGVEKTKYTFQMIKLLKDGYDKKGDIDTLDWLLLAQHFAKNQEEEVAF